MYLRHTTRKKDGKTHTYWRLVRSVRRGAKVVQETVAQLGELDAAGRASARQLAHRMTGRSAEQRELFEPSAEAETVAIQLDQVRLERSRSFGEVYLGWTLWRGLELDRVVGELLPPGRDGMTGLKSVKAAMYCAPTSPTGHPSNSGTPTFSSPRSRLPFASRSRTWRCDRFGIKKPAGSKLTSWSAFSPTSCGRPSNSGHSALGWGIAPGLCSPSLASCAAPTSCCRPT